MTVCERFEGFLLVWTILDRDNGVADVRAYRDPHGKHTESSVVALTPHAEVHLEDGCMDITDTHFCSSSALDTYYQLLRFIIISYPVHMP
jgi:hypothetical protein